MPHSCHSVLACCTLHQNHSSFQLWLQAIRRALALWMCPLCGGPMRVIERLTADQIQLRCPPLP